MARERMVTRTVKEIIAEVATLNIETLESKLETVTVVNVEDTADILKAAKKSYETATVKVVAVKSFTTKEVRYGMPEADFIKAARILPNLPTDNTAE